MISRTFIQQVMVVSFSSLITVLVARLVFPHPSTTTTESQGSSRSKLDVDFQESERPAPASSVTHLQAHPSEINRVLGTPQEVVEAPKAVAKPEPFSSQRMENDPDFQIKVENFISRRAYHKSPAKDSEESRAVVKLLGEHNVGIEGVRECYNAIWEHEQFLKELEWTPQKDKRNVDVFREQFKAEAEGRISFKFGITNREFFNKLFEIRPKIFFGPADLQVQEGEDINAYAE